MKSSTNHIRALLKEGYAYSEVAEITGYSRYDINQQGKVLENMGVRFRKKTDEEMKHYLLNTMRVGLIRDVLDDLTLEEVQWLMSKSLVSWADAIKRAIKEKEHDLL